MGADLVDRDVVNGASRTAFGVSSARVLIRRFVMADAGGKQTGILGKLRNTRETRRQRHAAKAHAKFEAKRGQERSGEAGRPPPDTRCAGGAA
jgi:hypothetical protein